MTKYFIKVYAYRMNLTLNFEGLSPGHVFVELVTKNGDYSDVDRAGFNPVNKIDSWPQIVDGNYYVEGEITNEEETEHDLEFENEISAEDYQGAKDVLFSWRNQTHKYILLSKDCLTFVIEMLNAARISTPSRKLITLPENYAEELKVELKDEHFNYINEFLDS